MDDHQAGGFDLLADTALPPAGWSRPPSPQVAPSTAQAQGCPPRSRSPPPSDPPRSTPTQRITQHHSRQRKHIRKRAVDQNPWKEGSSDLGVERRGRERMVRGGGEELRPCLMSGEGGRERVGGRSRGPGGRKAGKQWLGGEAGEDVEGAGRRWMAATEGGTDGGRRNQGSFPATGHGRSSGWDKGSGRTVRFWPLPRVFQDFLFYFLEKFLAPPTLYAQSHRWSSRETKIIKNKSNLYKDFIK